MGTESGRVEANLSSLLTFASALQSHLELMIRDISDTEALQSAVDDLAALGDFPEARELTARHRLSFEDVQDMLEELRDLIGFADDITLWVAGKYAERDRTTSDALHDIRSGLSA